MKRFQIIAGLCICLAVGLGVLLQGQASAEDQCTSEQVFKIAPVAPDMLGTKKCSFNSDCKYGKCSKGKCGACSFNSDCKGWGKCSKGQCGACSFNSECKGFGTCSGGHCTKSPY